jgi:hypothetical protein
MRAVVRSTLLAGMTGVLMVSVAWAGIGISPTPGAGSPTDLLAGASGTTTSATDSTTAATPSSTSTAALGAGHGHGCALPGRPLGDRPGEVHADGARLVRRHPERGADGR